MINQDKYYTPKLEEFYPGFMYEYKHGSLWILMSFGFDVLRLYPESPTKNETRVKYLDQEDIESLGFTDKDQVYEKFSFYKKCKNNIIYKIQTFWDMDLNNRENLIRIYKGTLHNYPYTEIFRGDIKNKSELKKLLKQLNIIDVK